MKLTHRVALIQILIVATLALLPLWLKLPTAPPPFSADYALGFVATLMMLATAGTWLLFGLPNVRTLFSNVWRMAWLFSLMAFVSWAYLSQFWAYERVAQAGVAQNAALMLAISGAFAVVCACCPPPVRAIWGVGVAWLVLLGVVGGLQVAQQSSVGLGALGESTLNPAKSGVSVIVADGVRWLRPYGLLPHPNIFAGFMLVSLLVTLPHCRESPKSWHYGIWGAGVWVFGLAFSRGAWLGFGVALALLVAIESLHSPSSARKQTLKRHARHLLLLGGLGIVFFLVYHPFVLARGGAGAENTEQQSIAERVLLNTIAIEAIKASPVQGLGAGNYAWYANRFIREQTPYRIRGKDVHNVPLLIMSELGGVGLGLFGANMVFGMWAIWQNTRRTRHPAPLIALVFVVAWVVVSLVDHYPYTLILCLPLWWGANALGFSVEQAQAQSALPHSPRP